MIVFIGCVKNKKSYPTKACELYDSTFFRKCFQYAQSLNPSDIYILSAKYGLVELTDVISPYDKTLNDMSKKERQEWAEMVYSQMVSKNIDFKENTIWLCGDKYRQGLIKYFENNKSPLEGMGIGCQLSYMTQQLNANKNDSVKSAKVEDLW